MQRKKVAFDGESDLSEEQESLRQRSLSTKLTDFFGERPPTEQLAQQKMLAKVRPRTNKYTRTLRPRKISKTKTPVFKDDTAMGSSHPPPNEVSRNFLSAEMDEGNDVNPEQFLREAKIQSFKDSLKNEQFIIHFTRFLESQLCAETIEFWKCADRYNKMPFNSADEKIAVGKEAFAIYERFVQVNSKEEINLGAGLREEIESKLAEGKVCTKLYENAKENIYQLMANDPYQRFLRSEDYQIFKKILEKDRSSSEIRIDHAEDKLSKFFGERPSRDMLEKRNIITDSTRTLERERIATKIELFLPRRPSVMEVKEKNIL